MGLCSGGAERWRRGERIPRAAFIGEEAREEGTAAELRHAGHGGLDPGEEGGSRSRCDRVGRLGGEGGAGDPVRCGWVLAGTVRAGGFVGSSDQRRPEVEGEPDGRGPSISYREREVAVGSSWAGCHARLGRATGWEARARAAAGLRKGRRRAGPAAFWPRQGE